ncbi:MAG: YihA family ribosome biogenesis GTP-binding protein [Chlorobi bacterium]|nr:YihA family ribosome biogenesis GTP-binding protein [Chlorobiota bacterium]
MKIKTAEFVVSNTDYKKCPKPDKPEYAFIGRSNVGKSSLINMLTGRKQLAKISGKPGKTKLINHFLINGSWYLVDLPGYGYAKVSKKERNIWKGFIKDYIMRRENLMNLFVLIDSRHKPQKNDTEFMRILGENAVPFVIIFTKTDKLSKKQLSENINLYKKELLKTWETIPEYFVSSSVTREGKDEILEFIDKTNKLFEKS